MPTVAEQDVRGPAGEPGSRQAPTYWLFWPWVALCVACLGVMWAAPGEEVVPFHLIWIGFALAYGFEPWPVPITGVTLGLATVLSGGCGA